MGIIRPNCKILRHEATIEIIQPAGAFTYFTDLTENHYKAMIDVRIANQTGAQATGQLIVTSRTGTVTIIDFVDSTVIQIEDAQSLTFNSTSIGVVQGEMNIIKDFCICCTDQGEVHRHEGTFFATRDFLFTDLTENHYKAMFVVLGNGTGDPSQAQVVVTSRSGAVTIIGLPPREQAIIQVEDSNSVLVDDLRAAPTGEQNNVQIIKDFCMRCP